MFEQYYIDKVSADSLYLPGHKEYSLDIAQPEPSAVYTKAFKCPFCLETAEKYVPRQSALRVLKTDIDLRTRFNKLETAYFEIVTCPSCCFSAAASHFEKADTSKEDKLFEALTPYRGFFDFSGKYLTDINAVFAGYYLAARCAPLCFVESDLLSARIWQRIYWLYGDCWDEVMAEAAGKKALELYTKVFQEAEMRGEQMARLKLILAQLSYLYGSKKIAYELLFQVAKDENAGAAFQRMASDRIMEIRGL